MICSKLMRATFVQALLVLGAAAIVLAGSSFPQTLTVTGRVTLKQADGTEMPATSDQTFASGTIVHTAKGSSAVVSLGKLGRVEVLPESTMQLSFDSTSLTVAMLEAGRVRVSSSSGTAATVATRNGKVVAVSTQENNFTVDTMCGNTVVATEKGMVELRVGGVISRVPEGSDIAVGTPKEGCGRATARQ